MHLIVTLVEAEKKCETKSLSFNPLYSLISLFINLADALIQSDKMTKGF